MSLRETPEGSQEHALDDAQHRGYLDALDGKPNKNPYAADPENFDNEGGLQSIKDWEDLKRAYDDAYNRQKNNQK